MKRGHKVLLLATIISLFTLAYSPVQADWSVVTTTDDMTGESSVIATSSFTKSVSPMGFPYANVKARMYAACTLRDDGSPFFWGYLHFTAVPNVTNSKIEYGSIILPVTMRWDSGEIGTHTFMQESGSEFLTPYDLSPAEFVANARSHNTLAIQLAWHGQNRPVFKISLAGSSAAIAAIVSTCKPL